MSGTNWEYQAPEVIAKEILIAMIEKGLIDSPNERTRSETVGEMYTTLVEEKRNSFK